MPLFVGPEVSSPDNCLKLTPFSFKRPTNEDQPSPGLVSGEEPPDKKKTVTLPFGVVTFFFIFGQRASACESNPVTRLGLHC